LPYNRPSVFELNKMMFVPDRQKDERINNQREEKESIDEGREENDREDNQPNATTLWLAACRYLISVFELNTIKRSCRLLVLEREKNQHNKTRRERKNRRGQGRPPPKKEA
jgi:hypothetical protein